MISSLRRRGFVGRRLLSLCVGTALQGLYYMCTRSYLTRWHCEDFFNRCISRSSLALVNLLLQAHHRKLSPPFMAEHTASKLTYNRAHIQQLSPDRTPQHRPSVPAASRSGRRRTRFERGDRQRAPALEGEASDEAGG